VFFSWRDEREIQHEAIRLTRDISMGSAFVLTKIPPPLQVPVHLEILLPVLRREATPPLMQGEGQVVRIEPAGTGRTRGGFAVVVKRFFLRHGEGAVTADAALASRATKKEEEKLQA